MSFRLSSLTALILILLIAIVGHVSALPAQDVLTPTGIPATSGLPFSTISFDTTANPSVLSALSSLISSESTAVTPYTSHLSIPTSSYTTETSATTSGSATQSTVATTSAAPTSTSSTSGARTLGDARWGIIASVIFGAAGVALVL
ncbi:hypothetical protein JVU11DRAFT_8721 [Chiua virens]|nr:hypothetical protein JVU11DRAFT_8721 [Chiua virens]